MSRNNVSFINKPLSSSIKVSPSKGEDRGRVSSLSEREYASCAERTETHLFSYSPINYSQKSTPHPNPLPQGAREQASFAKQADMNLSLFTSHFSREGKRYAFTLAETLITLGIIGVVAAITLPSVIEKHQKQVTVNKLKKIYSTLSQFVVRTYADNGPVSDFLSSNEVVSKNKTKEFFETYWVPYFNGAKAGNFYRGEDDNRYYRMLNGKKYDAAIISEYGLGRILFSTQDGTIYYVTVLKWVYDRDENGNIISQTGVYSTKQSATVDINGIKPPNRFGKDVFQFYIDFNDNIVRPSCDGYTMQQINNACKKGASYDSTCCAAKIIKDGWQIKDDYPW